MPERWTAPPSGDVGGTTLLATVPGHVPELSQLPSRSELTGRERPEAALRARINAVILDLLLLGLVSQFLAAALKSSTASPERALMFLLVEFAYFFLFEFASGRTIGKRAFHVHVVTASGASATARQIALRNALRIVDAVPFFYASGLISMMRTGPARRQRIGDVAAGTTVVLDEGGKSLRTPAWLLPMLTLVATIVSLLIVVAIADSHANGAGPGSKPLEGLWRAESTTISSIGYSNDAAHSAQWTLARRCGAETPSSGSSARQCPTYASLTWLGHLLPGCALPVRRSSEWSAAVSARALGHRLALQRERALCRRRRA